MDLRDAPPLQQAQAAIHSPRWHAAESESKLERWELESQRVGGGGWGGAVAVVGGGVGGGDTHTRPFSLPPNIAHWPAAADASRLARTANNRLLRLTANRPNWILGTWATGAMKTARGGCSQSR